VFLAALAASYMLTWLIRRGALRWGIVDLPDGRRKLHPGGIPLGGGVAVYSALVAGLILAVNVFSLGGQDLGELARVVIFSAGIVCFFGCIDDVFHLRARVKLLLQIAAVLPIVAFGYYIDSVVLFGYRLDLGWLGAPITVLWLLGCINALNLIDGMDGLASVVGLSTAGMMGLIAAGSGHPEVGVIALVLAGALAGFLAFNRPPAAIFLGDSGSMVIGLTVGVLGMQGAMKASATLSITAPVVVMALPMFDIVAAVVRRTLTGRRFDAPDRQHIHHRLLERGLNPWQVLCVLGALCLTTGAAAAAATIFRLDALAWITALVLVVMLIRLKLFGYHEFVLVREMLFRRAAAAARLAGSWLGWREQTSSAEISTLPLERAWQMLVDELQPSNVRRLELTFRDGPILGHRYWTDPRAADGRKCHWSVAVSMQERGDRHCELRADGLEKPREAASERRLTGLLKQFTDRLYEVHGNAQILPLLDEFHLVPAEAPDRRKAA
jgi:UDP-GlcNAc:undecaprenyl-phosphate/decaprenyl-phosphate GlcNAc-1-phosphate transferase